MSRLQQPWILGTLLLLACLAGAGFGLLQPHVGGVYLDTLADPEAARALLAALSPAQRAAHFQVTLFLDSLFPASFGLLCAGLALRLPAPWSRYGSMPAIMAILLDLAENGIQLLALSGSADLLAAKAWVTPGKFFLFALALAIGGISVAGAVLARIRRGEG